MKRELEVVPAIQDAVVMGVKNAFPLTLTVLLYVLTIWIPYLNVGTSIAMATIPGKLAQGQIINPVFIFDAIYRRRMGSFFLQTGLLSMMFSAAAAFMIVPAIVLSIMYSLALYIMIDENADAIESMKMSEKVTYGFKMRIFLISLLFGIVFIICAALIVALFSLTDSLFITILSGVIMIILFICCYTALNAVIYRNLFLNAKAEEEPVTEVAQ